LTQEELVSELQAAPGKERIAWAVLFEDPYETVHGDGYYAYFADAFFTREEAERFAATPSAYRFHIRPVQLSLRDGRLHTLCPELRQFEAIDTDGLISALSRDPSPRKPRIQY